jgi:hypothetical protein
MLAPQVRALFERSFAGNMVAVLPYRPYLIDLISRFEDENREFTYREGFE